VFASFPSPRVVGLRVLRDALLARAEPSSEHVSIPFTSSLICTRRRSSGDKFERAAMKWLRRYLHEKEPTLQSLAKVIRSLEQAPARWIERLTGWIRAASAGASPVARSSRRPGRASNRAVVASAGAFPRGEWTEAHSARFGCAAKRYPEGVERSDGGQRSDRGRSEEVGRQGHGRREPRGWRPTTGKGCEGKGRSGRNLGGRERQGRPRL